MKVEDKYLNKLAVAMVIIFFVYALWEQFAPQFTPGLVPIHRAQMLEKSTDPADRAEACKLYGEALRSGNRTAAFGVSDCIARQKEGSEESRRVLRYAVLSLAVPNLLDADANGRNPGQRDALAERDALGCTPDEISRARKLDVYKWLQGEVSVWDFAFSAVK